MSTFIRHTICQNCNSSDACSLYDDGHTYCFSCLYFTPPTTKEEENLSSSKFEEDFFTHQEVKTNVTPVNPTQFRELKDRAIVQRTAAFYKVWVNEREDHVYPYFDRKDPNTLAANKFRQTGTKGFLIQGDMNRTGLFGQQLFPAGSAKAITLVEGELDAMSVFQMTGSKWPAVSVKGASSARKDVADNFEYLNSFDKVVICFDKDEEHERSDGTKFRPGQDAAQKVAAMFPLGKVRLLTLKDAKDANDYLKAGWTDKFVNEWHRAPDWTPVGLKYAKDMWEEVAKDRNYDTVPYPWEGLNKLTYGIRLSELVTITAHTGVGKTSVLKEIIHNILRVILERDDDNRGVGLMFLEEPNQDTLLGLMSITANKPLHLPDVYRATSKEELKRYFDATYKSHEKVIVWDHFGSNEIDKVLDFVRYMHNLGCKYIVLDHLSIVVSDQSGDERKQLDEISTKLKQLCIELNIAVICVIHQNRKGEIRGTAGVEQLSNIVIKLYRDIKALDEEMRNTTQVMVEKNRFCGRTGPACLLTYSGETGRLTELPPDAFEELFKSKTDTKESDEW